LTDTSGADAIAAAEAALHAAAPAHVGWPRLPELVDPGHCDGLGPLWQLLPDTITLHGTEPAIGKGGETVVALMVAALYSAAVGAACVSRAAPYHPEQLSATAELLAAIPTQSKDIGGKVTTTPLYMVLDIQHAAPDVTVACNSGFESTVGLHFDQTEREQATAAGDWDAVFVMPSEADYEAACSRLKSAVAKLLEEDAWHTTTRRGHGGRRC
jgi:hypothetical protein